MFIKCQQIFQKKVEELVTKLELSRVLSFKQDNDCTALIKIHAKVHAIEQVQCLEMTIPILGRFYHP